MYPSSWTPTSGPISQSFRCWYEAYQKIAKKSPHVNTAHLGIPFDISFYICLGIKNSKSWIGRTQTHIESIRKWQIGLLYGTLEQKSANSATAMCFIVILCFISLILCKCLSLNIGMFQHPIERGQQEDQPVGWGSPVPYVTFTWHSNPGWGSIPEKKY